MWSACFEAQPKIWNLIYYFFVADSEKTQLTFNVFWEALTKPTRILLRIVVLWKPRVIITDLRINIGTHYVLLQILEWQKRWFIIIVKTHLSLYPHLHHIYSAYLAFPPILPFWASPEHYGIYIYVKNWQKYKCISWQRR